MMQQANCNVMSVGIFSWAKLEPQKAYLISPGWIMLLINCMPPGYMFLATPSGARPAWMSKAYPEVLRVGRDRDAGAARRSP